MPQNIGVNNVARRQLNEYIGVNSVARRAIRGWIGVNGAPRQFFGAVVIPTYSIDWQIEFHPELNPSDHGWPMSAREGEAIHIHLPYQDGYVPQFISVNGVPVQSASGNQGGANFEFTMPAEHTTVRIVYDPSGLDWWPVYGWNEEANGEYWQDPFGDTLFWDFHQPPGGSDVLLRGTFYFSYQPIEPISFVMRYNQDEHDPWTDGQGNYVYIHGRYGTLDACFGAMPAHNGWRLQNLEWTYDR